MTLAELNAMDRGRFVDALGGIFEDSPWVAERAWSSGPFNDIAALYAAMAQQVEDATREEQLALLRSHPDLGTRARISDASTGEQAAAGLQQLSAEESARLERLNRAYREKFNFPFLYAVKGGTKYDILQALERRLENPADDEFAEALRQVYRIAEFRLRDTVE
jgi:2-oxo-4-hydroxy-4-carboxy-5-ureidoimidazoline decarboxylase